MKKVFLLTTVAALAFASCKETKKEDTMKNVQENNMEDTKAEMVRKQDSLEMARKKTLDSLEQVKSHGHAH